MRQINFERKLNNEKEFRKKELDVSNARPHDRHVQ